MKLVDFDFNLPPELIAQTPSEKRDNSNLLVAGKNGPIKTKFYNIMDYLLPGDLLVFNNSKVIKAKLRLTKNDKKITINLNKPLSDNSWSAFAKPARKLHEGDEFFFDNHKVIISKKLNMGEIKVKFELENIDVYSNDLENWTVKQGVSVRSLDLLGEHANPPKFCGTNSSNHLSIFEFLDKYGEMPLPLYIKRPLPVKSDNDRYQTIYSDILGSVAAPTAGLHFTDEILKQIKAKGVQTAFLTLHTGGGTFLPVKSEDMNEHKMHSEYCSISLETAEIINKAKQEGRRIIAVGTTAMRTLESAVIQRRIKEGSFETDIFIKPGFKFQMVDMLLTNFHFPKSTLFMLVCAFAGHKEMHKLYKYAIKEKMRFFSYGDATLLYRTTI